jgi:competence protein ComGC
MGSPSLIREFWEFLRHRKRYWLLPIIIILLLLGILIVVAESSAVAPFIYTIF